MAFSAALMWKWVAPGAQNAQSCGCCLRNELISCLGFGQVGFGCSQGLVLVVSLELEALRLCCPCLFPSNLFALLIISAPEELLGSGRIQGCAECQLCSCPFLQLLFPRERRESPVGVLAVFQGCFYQGCFGGARIVMQNCNAEL